jgi:hypothetical protein
MNKMLFLSVEIEPFLSSFGSWCIPESYLDGWVIPSDQQWQDALSARGIDFTIIQIEDDSQDLP